VRPRSYADAANQLTLRLGRKRRTGELVAYFLKHRNRMGSRIVARQFFV
jgi:hypothetical protein